MNDLRAGGEVRLEGIAVSPGIAIGRVVFVDASPTTLSLLPLRPGGEGEELRKLDQAVHESLGQLEDLRRRVEREAGEREAQIFSTEMAILRDPYVLDQIREEIQKRSRTSEAAVRSVTHRLQNEFSRLDDEQFRERAADIKDVGERILRCLLRREQEAVLDREKKYVLITEELLPSYTVAGRIDRDRILGIVTERGGQLSHAAILAQSFGIPAVSGVQGLMDEVSLEDAVIVDGRRGLVLVNPTEESVREYESRQRHWLKVRASMQVGVEKPAVTRDGIRIELAANITNETELGSADLSILDGVGLFRTEFLYMERDSFPSEKEQTDYYVRVLDLAAGKPVVFRTVDIGGDKRLPYLQVPDEPNPVLGWRGVRVSFEWLDPFIVQLRALLRASARGALSILVPMVTSLGEVRRVRTILRQLQDDLRRDRIPFDPDVRLGMMVEVPAAATLIDEFVEEVEFVSVGTNDLIQYLLAVDRNNPKVASLYQPLHPAVIRVIREIVRAGREAGRPVTVCGDMAGNVNYTLLLLGLGLRSLSMVPSYLPAVKRLITSITVRQAEEIAEEALRLKTREDVKRFLRERTVSVSEEIRQLLEENGS